MPDNTTGGRLAHGAIPQNKALAPGETKGATPATTVTKPATPPPGKSGVTPPSDGSR